MTVLKIDQFGGLAPSVDARNLPPDGAQVASNVDLRFGDFRPARGLGAAVAAVPAGTKSIFRTPSGVWLHSATDTDYVNGQINDSPDERVYLTGRSAYPEVWQGGEYRRLGVPAPDSKPAATVVVVDEFDSTDASAAQEAATNAVLNAVLAADATAWLGNAAPVGVVPPPSSIDPLYAKVQLHIDFNALSSGDFTDKSPQKVPLTNEAGVSLGTGTGGPLGASGGAGYGVFAGGAAGGIAMSEIRRWRDETDPTWTVEATLTSPVDLDWVNIQCRDGNLREIAFQRADGTWRVLASSNYGGNFLNQLRCRRPNGAAAVPADTPTHIAVQCTTQWIEVYIDGVYCGHTPNKEGLELSNIGRSSWTTAHAFIGQMDEFRVTFAARYTSAGFAKPTAEFGTAALPTGAYVAHGDPLASSLPTTDDGDAAYVVALTATGSGFTTTNPADEYLRTGTLGGAQITYNSLPYWAVPLSNFRASGLTCSLATITSTLTAVQDPANPPTALLSPAQVSTLAPLIAALYGPSGSAVLSMIAELNSAQAELGRVLASGTATATALQSAITAMQSASSALETYFASISSEIQTVLVTNASALFGSIQAAVVQREVETRAYVVTYVTERGEESAPSPVTDLLTLDQNDHADVVAPLPPSGRFIVGWRLYRSSTTDRGAAFQLVTEDDALYAVKQNGAFAYFDIGTRTHRDTASQAELQEALQTLTWAEPPAGLKGLIGLPNGMMAGFVGKILYFCEPYQPYAWPAEYQHALKYNIVGLGVFGQTVVVLTEGTPTYASGADSASVSTQEIENPQSCIAKRTIANVEGGVMYASPDGLCLAGPGGVQVLTTGVFSKDDWLAEVGAASFGAYSDGSYYLFSGAP